MKNEDFLSMSEISSFARNMVTLNREGGFETEEERRQCKSSVEAMYAFAGKQITPGTVWNWGFDSKEIDGCIRAAIPAYDTVGTDGFSEQLYYFVLHATGIADFGNKKLLDVGCGFGEGDNFLSRAFDLPDVTGVDLCREAIDYANARFSRSGLVFTSGDAENLPFDDGEVDIVINIESSHTYSDLGRFLSEVERVLRPGGCFSQVDVFTRERHALLNELKAKSGLRWSKETDISEMVRQAIRKRMQSGSLLRQNLRKNKLKNVAMRGVLEPIMLVNYGASFAGHRFNLLQRAFAKVFWNIIKRSGGGSGQLDFEYYLHNLAWKD